MVNVTLNNKDEVAISVAGLPSEVDAYDLEKRLPAVSSVMAQAELLVLTVVGFLGQTMDRAFHLAGLAFLEESKRNFMGAVWIARGDAVASNYEFPKLADETSFGGF